MPGLKVGYGRNVEQRLSRLETNLERLEQSLQTGPVNDQLQSNIRLSVPTASTSQNLSQLQPGSAWSMPQQSAAGQQLDMTILSPSTMGPVTFPINAESASQDPSPEALLPPADVIMELTELYFSIVYPWAPLFDKSNFIANMWQPDRELLLHGIVVVASRFWDKATLSIAILQGRVRVSKNQLQLCCIDTCSLVTTQALALLAIDALAQGPGTRIWMLRSMLSAAVQQLGLTKEVIQKPPEPSTPMVGNEGLDNDPETSNIAAEERRRLFWAIFSIDQIASVALGQPSSVPHKLIKLRYPCPDDLWYQPSLMDQYQVGLPMRRASSVHAWCYYIDILTLLDRSNRILIQPCDLSMPAKRQEWQSHFRMMNLTLTTWFETCPERCHKPNENGFDVMWTMIRATYEL